MRLERPSNTTKELIAQRRVSATTEVSMRKVIDDFHAALLKDEDLAAVFAKVDREGLSLEQAHFLELAIGGDDDAECVLSRACRLTSLLSRARVLGSRQGVA
jgi:hypothetical protein